MKTLILTMGDTNLSILKEYLTLDNDLQFICYDDRITLSPDFLFIDCTLNFLDPILDINLLYQKFSKILVKLENIDFINTKIIILSNYNFITNDRLLNLKQKILLQFIELIIEYYSSYIFYIPFIISRISLNNFNHPIYNIINSIQNEKIIKIPYKNNSRFFIINDLDFINLFFELKNKEIKNIIIEGIEITLEEIYNKITNLSGFTPINFDNRIYFNYNFPEKNFETINMINYTFEDIIVELISKSI